MRPLLSILLLLSCPAIASADLVDSPPDDCAVGSVGHTSHSGQWCAPTTCATDADCAQVAQYGPPGGLVCRPDVSLCQRDEQYTPGRRIRNPEPQTRTVAAGPCVDGACPRGGECVSAMRCVARSDAAGESAEAPDGEENAAPAGEAASPSEEPASTAPEEDEGGCAAHPGRSGAPVLLLALGLLGWIRR